MSFSKILPFSDPSSITSLGITLMLMLMGFIYYYYYSMASSSKSSEPKKEESSTNSFVPKIMVSTSTSSIQNSFKYDVFLSFRGEDTRKNFVGHLYEALQAKCIETYKDDETIKQGQRINDQLLKSIEDSKFYIIVFSKNYTSSSWCLDELVKIMECHKMAEHTAFPVFYDVEPTEVRKQSGAVKEAFAEHEKKEAAGKWRDAMKELANLAGWELKATANGDESKSIQIIVDAIFKKLHSTHSSVDGKLVGMETRISDVLSSLEIGTEDVRMIGIRGIGGGGKTTLARAVYDQISNHFEGKSFVENVREISKPTLSGLKKLQKRILKDLLNKKDINLSSVHDGRDMLKATMRRRKILVVLDDVDRIEQLEALAGSSDWFKSGSRIIITTRDEQVLLAHQVNFVHDVDLLSQEEAICLFSRNAFQKEIPIQGYEELSEQVVQYADGLPLTIKVLGSFLCGKEKFEWEDAIDRLKRIPLKETLEKLELSYVSLEDEYKEIFLDIACILKGHTKEVAIRILESCGFHARTGLKVLEQRSLITISEDEVLGMHDHIEEMGENIVRRLHPDEPNKHSRLWIDEEIEDILADDMDTEATRCLKLYTTVNARIIMKALSKMKKLRYLEVKFAIYYNWESDPKFDDTSQYFTNSLKYLECLDYPFLYLPKTFQANNLVGLDMKRSRRMVQLWEDGEKKVLKNLKFLSLSESNLTTFDFKIAQNLETLILQESLLLVKLCMPFSCQKLNHLNISHSKLRSFDLGLTPNLETLSLESSGDLVELCMPVSCQKLKHLCISYSKLRTFDLGLTPNLETLSLESSGDLVELCMPVSCQKLNHLNISHSKLRSFDLGLTPNLETLSLESCANFVELHVSVACPNLKFLYLNYSKLRSLDLELIPNLERLDLKGCDKLVKINAPVGCLKKVVYFKLSGCLRFTDFEFNFGSELNQAGSSSATLLLSGRSLYHCPLHPNSNLPKLQFCGSYKEYLPSSVGNIEKLISFGLCACTDLKKFSDTICSLQSLKKVTLEWNIQEFTYNPEFTDIPEFTYDPEEFTAIPDIPEFTENPEFTYDPEFTDNPELTYDPEFECLKDLYQLECLDELCLNCSWTIHLPDSICMLKRLKSLRVNSDFYCCILRKLPEDLGQLECLEKLHVNCKIIESLPDSICVLKRLKELYVTDCCRLGKLPDDIGQLESLESLALQSTKIKHLPDSICKLKHLKFLNLSLCDLLEKLPENLGRLECLEKLDIISTGISDLPQSIFGLKGLLFAASPELLQKYAFPSEIKTTTSHISSVNNSTNN